jgi:hypothetical protein
LDPNLFWTHVVLGWTYEQRGWMDRAIAEYQKSISLSGGAVITIAALGHALGVAGRRAEAEGVLIQLAERSRQSYVSAYDIATVHAGLGDVEGTFTWLQRGLEERSSFLIHLQWDPRFDPVSSSPRFQEVISRVGLPAWRPGPFAAKAGQA